MSLYEIGKCDYCGEENQILRPSPFIADMGTMMCEYCWNDTQKEYAASNGEYIPDFDSKKDEYNNLLRQIKQKRKIVFPAIYKHFKNKYYATMGIPIIIPINKFITLEKHPNIISFNAEHTESGELYKIIRNKKQFYTYDDGYNTHNSNEQLILYKSLYDDHCPYLRPLDMFISEVDKIKYPKVKQEYRFELVKY